jgi:membrane fusion protein (multidrug efflux system)
MIKTTENEAPTQAPATPPIEEHKRRPKPILIGILAVIVVVGAVFGLREWQYITTHSGTDNAYVTADISQIAPEVSAMVEQVLVQDNQHVKKGDLLVVLDDSKYRAAVAQAKGNLAAAVADAKAAGVNVDLTQITGSAAEIQAQGIVEQSVGGVKGAEADELRAAAAFRAALAAQRTARVDARTAQTDVAVAKTNLDRSFLAVSDARAQLDAAKAGLSAAGASVDAAKARLDYAQKEADRMRSLSDSGAVSKQRYDDAESNFLAAQAQYEAARGQADAARAAVAGRQADLQSAQEAIDVAKATVTEAEERAEAAGSRHSAAISQSSAGHAQQVVARETVTQARGKKLQAAGQLKQAQTVAQQVAARQAMHVQALAKVEQAQAALETAELDLQRTKIYAPISGVVSNKTVEPGMLLQAGTPMLSLVSDTDVYIVANFKETQIEKMRPGQGVDVSVDGFGAHDFEGKVDSLASGTGSTFALLPADNATGNFVKVVQRVPVKIVLTPGQKDMDQLRAGMSVYVAVKLR